MCVHVAWDCICRKPTVLCSNFTFLVLINPRCACAARVIVLGSCVSLSVCLSVTTFSAITCSKPAKERYQMVQGCNVLIKNGDFIKVLCSKAVAWKPSEQVNVLISFGLPRPGSTCFRLRGHIRSYMKGDLRDLLRLWTRLLPLFSQQCMVWHSASTYRLHVRFSTYARAVFPMCAASKPYYIAPRVLHFSAFHLLLIWVHMDRGLWSVVFYMVYECDFSKLWCVCLKLFC